MIVRTPRRHISPRTKRRCRAIKNFLRRALGRSSHVKISSSIAINVTDLKHKIVILEQLLHDFSKHCQVLVGIESSARNGSQADVPELNHQDQTLENESECTNERVVEAKMTYKTAKNHEKPEESTSLAQPHCNNQSCELQTYEMETKTVRKKDRKSKNKKRLDNNRLVSSGSQPNLQKHKFPCSHENCAAVFSNSSYCSFLINDESQKVTRYHKHRDAYNSFCPQETTVRPHREHARRPRKPSPDMIGRRGKKKRKRHIGTEIDQDFIAEIIQQQYKPIKIFKESDFSQFSVPVCRDQDYTSPEDVDGCCEICSCCFEGHKKSKRKQELIDLHSSCNTRMQTSKRKARHGNYIKHTDIYNDSELYDLIPVKEKATQSPKPKRKTIPEENVTYHCNKEVPPSPITNKPRLNLKSQCYEFEDHIDETRLNKCDSPKSPHKFKKYSELDTTESSGVIHEDKRKLQSKTTAAQIHQETSMSNLNFSYFKDVNTTTLNKTPMDRTEKTLNEIKDILQSFLIELKKEIGSPSSTEEAEAAEEYCKQLKEDKGNHNPKMLHDSKQIINHENGLPQHPIESHVLPHISDPRWYPVLCPSCMQNRCMLPLLNYTCPSCANHANKDLFHKTKVSDESNNIKTSSQTEELIKEIYNYVAHTQSSQQNEPSHITKKSPENEAFIDNISKQDANVVTSRSAGRISKVKCYSKSCEAVCSGMSDTNYTQTNRTYSDTIFERISTKAKPTVSESDIDIEPPIKKKKPNKIMKVLCSFGFKKKRKDVIEEIEIEVKPKPKSPYREKITDHMVRGEQYKRTAKPLHLNSHNKYDCVHASESLVECCNPGHSRPVNPYKCHHEAISRSFCHEPCDYEQNVTTGCRINRPWYPIMFESNHNYHQRVPLCLKEIEVKNIGTQSDGKVPFFRKFTTKITRPITNSCCGRNCNTPQKHGKHNKNCWKTVPANINELDATEEGCCIDCNSEMRGGLLKKILHKRNPLSPRTLFKKILLGKDRSSLIQPPPIYRSRLFF